MSLRDSLTGNLRGIPNCRYYDILLVEALEGRVRPHQQFILAQLLAQIDHLEQTIELFDQEIEHYCQPFEKAVELVDTIPGIARRTAEILVSEIGTDMSCFPSAEH